MKVLVTGADGFVGTHLCGRLLADGVEVIPIVREEASSIAVRRPEDPLNPIRAPWPPHVVDLPDSESMIRIVNQTKPDWIVHLAALSTVPDSADLPSLARRVNVEGTSSVVRALHETKSKARLLFASSCIVHGPVPIGEQPVNEGTRTEPNSVYGETKLAAEEAVLSTAASLGAPPTIVRPFNHFGPGQSSNMVLSSFAKQIVAIKRGECDPVLRVGNLRVRREFLDVRDVVDAYRRIIDRDVDGLFTVASGAPYLLEDLVRRLGELAEVEFTIEIDPDRLRPNDLEVLSGDASRLKTATGWEPKIPLDRSLSEMLAYWEPQSASNRSLDSHR
ncbi:MAG: GDP-mannose 4,6-dehydratase [Planctomycetota bacterium]